VIDGSLSVGHAGRLRLLPGHVLRPIEDLIRDQRDDPAGPGRGRARLRVPRRAARGRRAPGRDRLGGDGRSSARFSSRTSGSPTSKGEPVLKGVSIDAEPARSRRWSATRLGQDLADQPDPALLRRRQRRG
jgi:hypothetical protein